MKPAQNFASAFCAHFGIAPEKYVDAVLGKALYPQARILIPFFSIFSRDMILRDRELLEELGHAASLREMETILRGLPTYYGRGWRFRSFLYLRLSSRRLLDLGRLVFAA